MRSQAHIMKEEIELVIFKISKNVDLKKVVVNFFYQKLFTKVRISHKLDKILLFSKNWPEFASFYLKLPYKSQVVFNKKMIRPPSLCPYTIVANQSL